MTLGHKLPISIFVFVFIAKPFFLSKENFSSSSFIEVQVANKNCIYFRCKTKFNFIHVFNVKELPQSNYSIYQISISFILGKTGKDLQIQKPPAFSERHFPQGYSGVAPNPVTDIYPPCDPGQVTPLSLWFLCKEGMVRIFTPRVTESGRANTRQASRMMQSRNL